jgi:chemotaxis protein methyltransferase CheR
VLNAELQQYFIRLIAEQTGLEIKAHDRASLSTKLLLRMRALKLSSPELYYQLLDAKTMESYQEWQNLIALLTNPESYFFRDQYQFNLLRNQIFPALIQRKQANKTIRICSAGCSTGEEPYSLAILLQELIPDLEQWKLTILGVDINSVFLEKAKAGVYRSWSLRRLDPAIQQRYFRVVNDDYHIDPRIKQLLKFQTLNLVSDPFPQLSSEMREMDLILCRNVFIYFEESAIAKVLDKFYHTLQPLGYLLTGHAELHAQNLSRFQTQVFPESLVYQRPERQIEVAADSTQPELMPIESIGSSYTSINSFLEENKIKTNNRREKVLIKDQPQKKIGLQSNCKDLIGSESPETQAASPLTEKALLQRAEILLQQNAYNLALEQVNKALAQNSGNAYPYYLTAQIFAKIHDYEKAVYYCQQSLEIDAFSVFPYYLLANIAEQQGDLVEAKRLLKKIIYLDSYFVAAYFKLRNIYQQEGDEKRSVKMQQAIVNILTQLPSTMQIPELDNLTVGELIGNPGIKLQDN